MTARKQNSTDYPFQFLMVDSADHLTAKTGLTPTVTLSKNGGAFAAAEGAVSEIGNGIYSLAGNAEDRDTLGELMIQASASGADTVFSKLLIVNYDPMEYVDALAKQSTANEILARILNPLVKIVSSIVDGKITAIRGDDWNLEIPCELPDSAKYQVALKRNKSIEDGGSALFVSSDKGLVILNGEPHATSSDASLAYNNVTQTLTLIVKPSVTMQLEPAEYRYGIQTIKDNVVKEMYQGSFVVTADVVRAIE